MQKKKKMKDVVMYSLIQGPKTSKKSQKKKREKKKQSKCK